MAPVKAKALTSAQLDVLVSFFDNGMRNQKNNCSTIADAATQTGLTYDRVYKWIANHRDKIKLGGVRKGGAHYRKSGKPRPSNGYNIFCSQTEVPKHLSFGEKSAIWGPAWQSLTLAEREAYNTQAAAARQKDRTEALIGEPLNLRKAYLLRELLHNYDQLERTGVDCASLLVEKNQINLHMGTKHGLKFMDRKGAKVDKIGDEFRLFAQNARKNADKENEEPPADEPDTHTLSNDLPIQSAASVSFNSLGGLPATTSSSPSMPMQPPSRATSKSQSTEPSQPSIVNSSERMPSQSSSRGSSNSAHQPSRRGSSKNVPCQRSTSGSFNSVPCPPSMPALSKSVQGQPSARGSSNIAFQKSKRGSPKSVPRQPSTRGSSKVASCPPSTTAHSKSVGCQPSARGSSNSACQPSTAASALSVPWQPSVRALFNSLTDEPSTTSLPGNEPDNEISVPHLSENDQWELGKQLAEDHNRKKVVMPQKKVKRGKRPLLEVNTRIRRLYPVTMPDGLPGTDWFYGTVTKATPTECIITFDVTDDDGPLHMTKKQFGKWNGKSLYVLPPQDIDQPERIE